MSKVKCPKCGHMNHPNEDHCSNCGYSLKQTKEASTISFLQSMYKTAMACPRAAGDVDLNTKNRDKTIERHNYGPLNLNDKGYWEFVADKWNTTTEVAKKSTCGNCVAFDVSPRMDDCMPGPVSDREGRLGYCWMHHFKCHSARTCTTWAKGGPIKKDEVSHDWQKKAKGMEKEAFYATNKEVAALVGIPAVIGSGATMAHNIRNDRDLTDNVGKGALYGAGVGLGGTLLNHGLMLDRAGIPNAIPYIGGSALGGYLATKEAEDSSVKSDILKAFKAEGGALGMKALKKHVKAPDAQARLKDLMEEGRVYKHRHGDFIEKESSAVMPLAVGGGLVGAGLGAVADKDNRLRGAAIGGGLGALGGFAGGKAVDHIVDTDPGVIRARQGAAKAEADLRQTIADGKAQSKKLDADLAEAKKKTARARETTKQIKARLEQVTADEKAGKISPMEAVDRRVKILQEMAGLQKEARMLPGQFSGATKAYDSLASIAAKAAKRTPVKPLPLNSKATPTAASSLKTRLDDIYAQYQKKQSALNSRYATKTAAEGEYDDSHMLSKILMRMSAQSAHLKEKIDAGLILPSWAEYKLYNAYTSLGSALGTAYPGEYDKEAAATATKTDPAKWEAAKSEAKSKMGGKHSARAMQLATQIYKKNGGGYSGSKPSSKNNSLKKWTKQDWGYSGKDKPGQGGSGVYLPKRRRAALKATKKGRSMLASATRKKHKATSQGRQYSSHGLAAGTSLKKTASSRVKSPHAFYQPTQVTAPPPEMNPGNTNVVNQQAQSHAMAAKNREQQAQAMMSQPTPPSIQQNSPSVPQPFKPKYTGMP